MPLELGNVDQRCESGASQWVVYYTSPSARAGYRVPCRVRCTPAYACVYMCTASSSSLEAGLRGRVRTAVDDFVLFLSRMRSKFSKRHDTRVCLANLFAWPRADQIRGGLTERARRGRRGRRAGERGARNAFVPLAHAQLDGVPVLPVLF